MSSIWIYSIPNWQLALLIIGAFVILSLAGVPVARGLIGPKLREGGESEHNGLINNYLSAISVFYGLTIGLIAVAVWQNMEAVEQVVSREAASVTKLYRDTIGYPTEHRVRVRKHLADYVDCVVEREWPLQRRGQIPRDAVPIVDALVEESVAFEPKTEGQRIVHAEFFKILNEMQELRRQRLGSVEDSLPSAVWAVVWIGALIVVALTYLFWTRSFWLHLLLNTSLGMTIGLLVFLIVALDHPFWGNVSVGPEAFTETRSYVMGK